MDKDFGPFIYFLLIAAGVIGTVIRRVMETRKVEQRKRETPWNAKDLPEETRRMLFGDKMPPAARPAQPRQTPEPYVQVRDMIDELRRRTEAPTAKPRQSASTLSPVFQPQPQARQQPQARPLTQRQVEAAQAQRPPAPPRQLAPQQPPRMFIPQTEGSMPRQAQAQPQRQPQKPRRQPQRVPATARENEEGPHTPFPFASQKKSRTKGTPSASRWFSNPHDLRRAIILSEILGPPKALQ